MYVHVNPFDIYVKAPTTPLPPVMGLPDICTQYEPFFQLSDARLQSIVARFRTEFEGGLSEYGKDMAMVPSFVTGVPDGSEEGRVFLPDTKGLGS